MIVAVNEPSPVTLGEQSPEQVMPSNNPIVTVTFVSSSSPLTVYLNCAVWPAVRFVLESVMLSSGAAAWAGAGATRSTLPVSARTATPARNRPAARARLPRTV